MDLTINQQRPFIGIAVILINPQYPNCVLISKRLSSHGKDSYQLPGGHLEYGESFEQCAERELLEETNLHLKSFQFVYITNTIFEQQSKHYVTIFMKTVINDCSTLKCMEPEKNSDWIWMKWEDLKQMNLFEPLRKAVDDQLFNPFH